jgi:hypothetical protein
MGRRTGLRGSRKNGVRQGRATTGLKPGLILRDLRGPEGPLFHGDGCICDQPTQAYLKVIAHEPERVEHVLNSRLR